MARSNYLRNKLLDHCIGGGPFTRPVNIYLALMIAMPTGAGGGTEVTGFGYARKQLVNDATFFADAAAGLSKANTANIAFAPAVGGTWGGGGSPIIGAAFYDAPTGGNLLDFTELEASRVVPDGGILIFLPGDIVFEDVA